MSLAPEKAAVMDRLMKDMDRAKVLGLLPQDGGKISARGEFIVDPSNIENDENKRMRSYRHKAYPRTLHGWDEQTDAPVTLSVLNAAEEDRALTAGWTREPHYGPSGRLYPNGGAPVVEEVQEVREFAPPGQRQPFDVTHSTEADAVPEKPKRGRPKVKKG